MLDFNRTSGSARSPVAAALDLAVVESIAKLFSTATAGSTERRGRSPSIHPPVATRAVIGTCELGA
jgi:hypothetical protein